MAICLTLLPVTALEFIIVRFAPTVNMSFLYQTYFPIWLVLTVFFILKKDIAFTNKWTLISGGFLGLLVPIANGVATGNWMWIAYQKGYQHILLVDLLWLILGIVSLWIAFFKLKTKKAALKPSIN